MNNTFIAMAIALLLFSFVSCTKNNTTEPDNPSGKKLVKAIGGVEDGDTTLFAYFNYDSNGRLIRFNTGIDEEASHYKNTYIFNRDADGIVTDFQYIDSGFERGQGLDLIWIENWKPFYDKGNQRYTYALRTHERFRKRNDGIWEQETTLKYYVDSIAYMYSGDKINRIEYYSTVKVPDEEYQRSYSDEGHTELIRDALGRVTRLTEKGRLGDILEDLLTEYDDKMNPLNFGKDGIFLVEECEIANFNSENNYLTFRENFDGISDTYEYVYDEHGYPISNKIHSIWDTGNDYTYTEVYLYK